MEKFVFTKKVSLGFLKRNAVPGQIVSFSKNYAMFQNEKVTDFRDFQILKRHGFLIPFQKAQKDIFQKKQQAINTEKSKFGFQVKHEKEQTNIIPLDKFLKTVQLNQDQAFVQDSGVILQQTPKEIHVAKATETKKKEQTSKEVKKQEQNVQVKKKTVAKKQQEQKKVSETKSAKKVSKKTDSKTKKSTDKVRGMTIIREEN